MTTIRLLAVVEVEKSERVICRAPKCGHSVYKRIHVTKIDDKITVLGSECFKKICGQKTSAKPHYGTFTGRILTPEERQLLIENTEHLIAQFEAEVQAVTARKAIPPPIPLKAHPTPPINTAKEWERREAAREAWRLDKQLLEYGIPTPPPPSKEWVNWDAADWTEWAKKRMAGNAQWIDTPGARAAWNALLKKT